MQICGLQYFQNNTSKKKDIPYTEFLPQGNSNFTTNFMRILLNGLTYNYILKSKLRVTYDQVT